MHRILAVFLMSASAPWIGCAAAPAADVGPRPSPTLQIAALELGAQLNPFANSVTHKVRYVNVSRVQPGSVAARAGLLNADHIVEINGLKLSDYRISEVPDIRVEPVGHRIAVRLKVVRKGAAEPVALTLVFENCDGVLEWRLSDSQPIKEPVPRAE